MSKKLLLAVLVLVSFSTGLCVAQSTNFFFRNGDRIVFVGDSITQQRLYTTYIEAYTLTRFPAQSFVFRNAGWSGDTAWLRKRFKTDEKVLFPPKVLPSKNWSIRPSNTASPVMCFH